MKGPRNVIGSLSIWELRPKCMTPSFHSSLFFCPDTFASKVAAIQDQYADASIGNVTGSNAVNVFLGIGVSPACLKMDDLTHS